MYCHRGLPAPGNALHEDCLLLPAARRLPPHRCHKNPADAPHQCHRCVSGSSQCGIRALFRHCGCPECCMFPARSRFHSTRWRSAPASPRSPHLSCCAGRHAFRCRWTQTTARPYCGNRSCQKTACRTPSGCCSTGSGCAPPDSGKSSSGRRARRCRSAPRQTVPLSPCAAPRTAAHTSRHLRRSVTCIPLNAPPPSATPCFLMLCSPTYSTHTFPGT